MTMLIAWFDNSAKFPCRPEKPQTIMCRAAWVDAPNNQGTRTISLTLLAR